MFQFGVPETFSFRRFLIAVPLAIAVVVVVLVVLELIVAAILQPDPSFAPLTPSAVATMTVISLVPASIVYGLIGAFTRRPWTIWYVIAVIGLLITLIPDFSLFLPNNPMFPVITTPYILSLIFFHLVGAAIFIPLLPRWSAQTS